MVHAICNQALNHTIHLMHEYSKAPHPDELSGVLYLGILADFTWGLPEKHPAFYGGAGR